MPYVTELHEEFLRHIEQLEKTSKAADEASCLTGQRKWMNPPLQGWSGDPQDITGLNKAFTRKAMNALYVAIMRDETPNGTIGETMVLKLMVDYIAALERAFRTRHCSSVRAKLHAAGRRRGQGSKDGLFTGSVVLWLERLLLAAHDDPYEGVAPGDPPND